jgi:hypothetical protein
MPKYSKHDTESNTKYTYKNDGCTKDNLFIGNVFHELRMHGLSGHEINAMMLAEQV